MSVKLRILIADDDTDSVCVLAELMRERGHSVREAYDGTQALHMATEFRPHVMILDIVMPGMDGYEVCERVRVVPWGRDILAVALSGRGDFEDKWRSRRVGFDYHVIKPAEFEQVIRLVERSDTCLEESSKLLRPSANSCVLQGRLSRHKPPTALPSLTTLG